MNILVSGGDHVAVTFIWQLLNKPGFNGKVIWLAPDIDGDTIGRGNDFPKILQPDDKYYNVQGSALHDRPAREVIVDPNEPDAVSNYMLELMQVGQLVEGGTAGREIDFNCYPYASHLGNFYYALAQKIKADPRVEARPYDVTDFFFTASGKIFVIGHVPGNNGEHETWNVDRLILSSGKRKLPLDFSHLDPLAIATGPCDLSANRKINHLMYRDKKNSLSIGIVGAGAGHVQSLQQIQALYEQDFIGKVTYHVYAEDKPKLWTLQDASARYGTYMLRMKPYQLEHLTPENLRQKSSESFSRKIENLTLIELGKLAEEDYENPNAALFQALLQPATATALLQAAEEHSPEGAQLFVSQLRSIFNGRLSWASLRAIHVKGGEEADIHFTNKKVTIKPEHLKSVWESDRVSYTTITNTWDDAPDPSHDFVFWSAPYVKQWTPVLVAQLDVQDPLRILHDNHYARLNHHGVFEIEPEHAGKIIGIGPAFSPIQEVQGAAFSAQNAIARIFLQGQQPGHRIEPRDPGPPPP